jgi:tellurium resistance protein TerZ
MGISLVKGQKISLDKESGGGLTRIFMGLGWDVAKSSKKGLLGGLFGGNGGGSIDLDASCVMFDESGQQVDVVWFRQLKSRDGSVVHSGDNLTGEGEGDDEVINIDLTRVPAGVKSLVFTVNSFRGQDFSTVANAVCRVVDAAAGREIARYDLSASGPHTGMIMAKLYRHNQEWKLHAIGEPGQGRTFDAMMPQIRGML